MPIRPKARAFRHLKLVHMNDNIRNICPKMDAWRCCLHPSRLEARAQRHKYASLTSRRTSVWIVLSDCPTPTRGRTPMEASSANAVAATFPTPEGPDGPGRIYALPKDGPCEDRKYCDIWTVHGSGVGMWMGEIDHQRETSFVTVIACSCAAMHVV